MDSNGKMVVAKKDERRHDSMVEELPTEAPQPLGDQAVRKPRMLADSKRPLHSVPPIYDQALHRMAVVLATLVLMCLVLAVVVWWRLLA